MAKLISFHGERCPYCQRVMDRRSARLRPTRDHHVPESRGGIETVICCLTCNAIKADMMPAEWAAFRAAFPNWWLLSRLDLARAKRAHMAARWAMMDGVTRGRATGTP